MIETLFPIKIYKTRYEKVDELAAFCTPEFIDSDEPGIFDLKLFDPEVTVTTYRAWKENSEYEMPHTTKPFQDLTKFIETHAKTYWDELGYFADLYPKVAQSWVQYYKKFGYINVHTHIPYRIASVTYISADAGDGNLVFCNPNDTVLAYNPAVRYGSENNPIFHEVRVQSGDVILFPGWLKHFVVPTQTDKKRIVFVANLNEQTV
jgi:uncharacterized protein (TIGR02466 family)